MRALLLFVSWTDICSIVTFIDIFIKIYFTNFMLDIISTLVWQLNVPNNPGQYDSTKIDYLQFDFYVLFFPIISSFIIRISISWYCYARDVFLKLNSIFIFSSVIFWHTTIWLRISIWLSISTTQHRDVASHQHRKTYAPRNFVYTLALFKFVIERLALKCLFNFCLKRWSPLIIEIILT